MCIKIRHNSFKTSNISKNKKVLKNNDNYRHHLLS